MGTRTPWGGVWVGCSMRLPSGRPGGRAGAGLHRGEHHSPPFFERRGFRVGREQIAMVRSVGMKNFVMEKDLLRQERGATLE